MNNYRFRSPVVYLSTPGAPRSERLRAALRPSIMHQLRRAGMLVALTGLAGGCRTVGPNDQSAPASAMDAREPPGAMTVPGSVRLDARLVMPGTDTMIMSRDAEAEAVSSLSRPGRVVVGMTIETVRRATDETGRKVLDVTFEERDGTGVVGRTTTRVDAGSLLPLRQRAQLGGGHVVSLLYTGGHVVGVDSAPDRPAHLFNAPVPDTAYTSGAIDLLLRALPLADGFRTTVPLYFPAENVLQALPVRVEARERITTRAGHPSDCWLVAADFPGDITEHFWVDQTSHAIVRILAHESETSLVRYDR